MRICDDAELRKKLYQGGVDTANSRDWEALKDRILEFYDCKNLKNFK